jgi:sugar lactone lactonase YvrE
MIAAAAALMAMSGHRLYAQGADYNAAPNPYKVEDNWAKLADGQKFGSAIKVQVDHSDGKSVWVFDRCESNECTNSTIPPLRKFDSSGTFQKAIGAGLFAVPHSLYVDRDGNVWAGDQIARNGKGADLIKLAPDGRVLMTLGKPGMPGNGPDYLSAVSAVVVAPNGKFVAEWRQFGRPSDVAIDKNDMIYVADSQSSPTNNPGFKQGIRIGSAKDGKVTAFIPQLSAEAGAPEGVGVDDAGNVYAGWVEKKAVRKFVKQ